MTLAYAEHGVALMGTTEHGGGYQSDAPPTLLRSTDLVHWRDITPPAVRRDARDGVYSYFDEASFLNPDVGLVTTWSSFDLAVTMYETKDGGGTWAVLGTSARGDHAGDADYVQLLSPSTIFSETIAATASRVQLDVTTDAERTWRTTYEQPTSSGERSAGPFGLPMRFINSRDGFAAADIAAANFDNYGDFFVTHDSGAHWQRTTPPRPSMKACASLNSPSSASCRYSLPTFDDQSHGVVAAEVADANHTAITFATTSNAGTTWRAAATLDLPSAVTWISMPSAHTWWVVAAATQGLVTQTTTDGGSHWSTHVAQGLRPAHLSALDATHALLTSTVTTTDGSTSVPYATTDAGATWQRLSAG